MTVAVALFSCAVPAAGEPIPLTVGNITFDITESPFAIFSLPQIGFFSVFGTPGRGSYPLPPCCTPGGPVNLSIDVAFRDGVTNRLLEGRFETPQTTISIPSSPTGLAGASAPFTFSGRLQCEPGAADCVALDLMGVGTAGIILIGGNSFRTATYQFRNVDPIPEPGTLTLLALGLATGMAARRRRKVEQARRSP